MKKLPDSTVEGLVRIVNVDLEVQTFPNIWKRVDVVMILRRSNDVKFLLNYMPIILLSGLGRVLEVVVLRRLGDELQKLIKPVQVEQFGFRDGLPTDF